MSWLDADLKGKTGRCATSEVRDNAWRPRKVMGQNWRRLKRGSLETVKGSGNIIVNLAYG